ncbi:hypothetical protein [Parafrigoribacterium humi]|uniref:hypothetical protein n=1 Tax=Parafrigoribacterium humi TaxID=3144664 RepID=UPI00387E6667
MPAAAMESFWSLLREKFLDQRTWPTRQELRLVIVVWTERKFHRQRPQAALGGLTTVEFEAKRAQAANLAARTATVTNPCTRPQSRS